MVLTAPTHGFFYFLYLMLKPEITSEEKELQKAARKRFREIVKQRWQEETLKTLSQKALKKLNNYPDSPLSLGEGQGVRIQDAGGSLRIRFSQGVWYLHFTFFGKKVESTAATLTEAINGLIINKHLQNSQFTIQN